MFINLILSCLLTITLTVSVEAGVIKLAGLPLRDHAKYQPILDSLADYLSEKTGERVVTSIPRDYAEVIQRIQEKSVDVVWMTPANYVKAKAMSPSIRYMVTTLVPKGDKTHSPFYVSYIVSMKKSNISDITQLKNKKFAFTDKNSTSGYYYPRITLRKLGIDPDQDFKKIFFLKKHSRVAQAIISGAVDAGVMLESQYLHTIKTKGNIFNKLAQTDPMPFLPIVATENVSNELVDELQKAFVTIPQNHEFFGLVEKLQGFKISGFAILSDAFYDSLRNVLGY